MGIHKFLMLGLICYLQISLLSNRLCISSFPGCTLVVPGYLGYLSAIVCRASILILSSCIILPLRPLSFIPQKQMAGWWKCWGTAGCCQARVTHLCSHYNFFRHFYFEKMVRSLQQPNRIKNTRQSGVRSGSLIILGTSKTLLLAQVEALSQTHYSV